MTELPRAGTRPTAFSARLPALTGLRFIAAAMVFFYHALWQRFFTSEEHQSTAHSLFYQGGWAGVSFFFILSGFILTWSVRPGDTVPAFLRRRFFKIYPLHLVTFAAALGLAAWLTPVPLAVGDAILNALLMQSWSPDIMVRSSFNAVAWSLSCEVLFYALFPLLIRLINRIRPERLWGWAAAVVAMVFAVPLLARLLPDQAPLPPVNVTVSEMWLVYQFPGTRLLDFVFGILLARIVLERRRLPFSFGGSLALTVAAYALAPMFPSGYYPVAVMLVPLGLLVASCAAETSAGARTLLSSRVMVRLGEVSFAFYMTHALVLTYGHRLLGQNESWSAPGAIGVLALLFGATLLLSWLLFTLVEGPVMRRFATSRRRRGQAVTNTARTAETMGPGGAAEPAAARESTLL
ncbi:acyltransferase family protein [Streptomyces jumonjinensis]|uniref:acyltransferase family protein n=1 Tax=Streptomyces jumonjinensis TaxID=1945 RepID=UPI0037900AC6